MMFTLKKIVLFPISLFVAFLALMAKWLLTLSSYVVAPLMLYIFGCGIYTAYRQTWDQFSFCWWQSLSASFSFSAQLPSQRASDGSANGLQNCKCFYLCRLRAAFLFGAANATSGSSIGCHTGVIQNGRNTADCIAQNKGKSVAACLKSRTDYAKNPDKTNRGELVSSYECSPLTADEEFMLSKRQYELSTGRRQKMM